MSASATHTNGSDAYALWLYGSHARGDHDELSDVDVLLVSEASCRPESIVRIAPELSSFDPEQLSISHYTWSEFDAMREYGSLFLRHIRDEALLMCADHTAKEKLSQLTSMPPYRYVQRDLSAFWMTLDDIRNSPRSMSSPIFETTVLATVLRHASVLANYVVGSPVYARRAGFQAAVDSLGLPSSWAEWMSALHRTKTLNQAQEAGSLDWVLVDEWTDRAACFLDRIGGYTDE